MNGNEGRGEIGVRSCEIVPSSYYNHGSNREWNYVRITMTTPNTSMVCAPVALRWIPIIIQRYRRGQNTREHSRQKGTGYQFCPLLVRNNNGLYYCYLEGLNDKKKKEGIRQISEHVRFTRERRKELKGGKATISWLCVHMMSDNSSRSTTRPRKGREWYPPPSLLPSFPPLFHCLE